MKSTQRAGDTFVELAEAPEQVERVLHALLLRYLPNFGELLQHTVDRFLNC